MRLFTTIAGLRSAIDRQRQDRTIGLFPTMGALHSGHSLAIERAVKENDIVVVSIFVNPLQFGPNEDLDQYPRQLETDCQLCERLGVKLVFAPTTAELYEHKPTVAVVPPTQMISVLCGQFRAGHFEGVATIVTKLLNIVQPTTAYFGEKDAQQLAIVRRLIADLNIPVEIKAIPIVREASGLAYSSRNQYLTPEEKQRALILSRSLQEAQKFFESGVRDALELIGIVKQKLTRESQVKVQYVELVHPDTLKPLEKIEEVGLLAIACFVGSTRLIDNVILRSRAPIIAIDGPAGAGKSTVTRRIARNLDLLYLDTGAMYRAVTWLVMGSEISLSDEPTIAELVSKAKIELIPDDSWEFPTSVKINGEDVTRAIRSPQVTANVSAIAAMVSVRQQLVKQQQRWGDRGGVVVEGRDIGTNVFPDAELKIYLTASVGERAKRRAKEFKDTQQQEIDIEQLKKEIQQRDDRDSKRQIAPLKKASDAIEINTDGLTIEEVVQQVISLYEQKFSIQ